MKYCLTKPQIATATISWVSWKPRKEISEKIAVPVDWQVLSQVNLLGTPVVGQRFSSLIGKGGIR